MGRKWRSGNADFEGNHMPMCQAKTGSTAKRNLTDQELVDGVRAGNTALYGALVDRYHRRLYCVALRILKNDAEAEDALQDAYILALTRLDQFAGRSSFFTWMARITMNEAFTRIRGRRRVQRLAEAVESPGNFRRLFPLVETPEQQAIHGELRGVLESYVRALPERYRSVFAMREVEELSTNEAALTLGITEECVKTRLHRARELLKSRVARRVRRWNERAA
jgi:RNA polymerase sigma-70 factor, ECF subfamily